MHSQQGTKSAIADPARSAVAPDGTMHPEQSIPFWIKPVAVTSIIAACEYGPEACECHRRRRLALSAGEAVRCCIYLIL